MSILTQRIKIPYSIYNYKKLDIIKSLIGTSAKIIEIKSNDIILDDESVIVDVKYSAIKLSQLKIYYVKIEDMKRISPNSNKYALVIEGCNVLLDLKNKENYKNIIPIKIASMNNIENYQYFQYYSIPVKNPMNHLCTISTVGCKYNIEKIDKIYPDNYELKNKYSKQSIIAAYKYDISKFPILQNVKNVIEAKEYEECINENTGYLIDWYKLIKNREYLNGVVIIQSIREPFLVAYIPNTIFNITEDDIWSVGNFLEQDKNNLYNFDYAMNVLNN